MTAVADLSAVRISKATMASIALGAFLTFLHGLLPFWIASLSTWYTSVGAIRCGEQSLRDLLGATCHAVGGEAGADVGNGWPITVAGGFLGRLTGVSADWILTFLAFATMTLSVLGVVELCWRFGISKPLGLLAALLYLGSPTVLGMSSFGSTLWGIALIPAVIWLQQTAVDVISRRRRRVVILLPLWAAGAFVFLAIDGYAFVMAQAATGLLLLVQRYGVRAERWKVAMSSFAASNAAAYLTYRALAPANIENRSSIDLFRAMGLDVITLIRPTAFQWWAASSWDVDSTLLWGDGTNSRFNYVGLVAAVLAAIGITVCIRRRSPLLWWAVIGAISLFLALGPSLKFNEVRGPLQTPVTYDSYLMPASDAVLTLPTHIAYERLPGLNTMRATYRWFALTRLAEALLVAAGLQYLLKRRGLWPVVACIAAVLAVVELSPPLKTMLPAYAHKGKARSDLNATVIEPLDAALPDGARVVLSPNASGSNDFLASYIATGAHLRLYNVGGDKALGESLQSWPRDIKRLLTQQPGDPRLIDKVLRERRADAVVVPRFDLRWDVESWPPSATNVARGDAALAALRSEPRLHVDDLGRLAVVTLVRADSPPLS